MILGDASYLGKILYINKSSDQTCNGCNSSVCIFIALWRNLIFVVLCCIMQRTGIYVSCKKHRIGWLFIATFHQFALIHDKYTSLLVTMITYITKACLLISYLLLPNWSLFHRIPDLQKVHKLVIYEKQITLKRRAITMLRDIT